MTPKTWIVGTIAAGSLVAASVALAAPDREISLSAAQPMTTWDGGPVTGVDAARADDDDTLLKLADDGNLAVTTSEASGNAVDLDLYVYRANAAGEPQGDALVAGEEFSPDESVSVRNLKAGTPYLIRVVGYVAAGATYKGTAKLTPIAGGPGGPSGPTGPGGTTDLTPIAAFKGLPRSAKAKKFRKLKGTATDDQGVTRVEVALVLSKGKKCKQLKGKKFVALKKCTGPTSFGTAKGTTKWSFKLPKLKKGKYTAFARAVDSAGQRQAGYTKANKKSFKLK